MQKSLHTRFLDILQRASKRHVKLCVCAAAAAAAAAAVLASSHKVEMCVLLCYAVQPAKELKVHLCTDPQHHKLLTPQHIQPNAGRTTPASTAAVATGGDSSGFTTPTRKTPGASASKGSASSSSKKSKSGSKGSKQQRQEGAHEASTAGAVSPAVQWQLQLLQEGLDWSKPRQRKLMQQLLHKQLLGSSFLKGMWVPVITTLMWPRAQPDPGSVPAHGKRVASCIGSYTRSFCASNVAIYLHGIHNLQPERPMSCVQSLSGHLLGQ